MKKILVLAICLMFVLTACKQPNSAQSNSSTQNSTNKSNYESFLDSLKVSQRDLYYFIKDIDGNGTADLIMHENTKLSVYTCEDSVKLIGEHDFLTGTARYFSSSNANYPGIFYFTVGGGAEHYGYMTIKDKKLSFENLWEDNYATEPKDSDNRIIELSSNKELIAESKLLFEQNKDIKFISLNNNSSANNQQTNTSSSQQTTEIIVIPTTDKTTVPHNDISASQLTNEQAKEILEVLIPKQFEVFDLFQLDYERFDNNQTMPGNKWYKLCTDKRFSCVQDIKDFISQVYTGKQEKWYFDVYLDCEPTINDTNSGCYYLDYDGKLYRSILTLGKGLNFNNYLMDTTRITERTENTVSIEMDAQDREDYLGEVYKFLLCKTENGWRLDSPILDSYYLD